MSNRPVLLVDGLNIFMRHFVVNPSLSESGLHIGGAIGFMNGLKSLCRMIGPEKVVVVWEGGGSPRRRAIYKNYKQGKRPQRLNRYYSDDLPDTVENRDNQISLIIDLLKEVGIQQIYVADCEADDIIGYLTKYKFSEKRVVIASSDKDLYQLLTKKVIQWSPGQKKFITKKDVLEKFGISCENFCTARCFVGDASDGLPGVPRAGFATLKKRFPELSSDTFVGVEKIVNDSRKLVENSSLSIYTNIVENEEIATRNWKLMNLDIRNLSASQIDKVDFLLEQDDLQTNKMALIRKMYAAGIRNFDIDTFFSSITSSTSRRP